MNILELTLIATIIMLLAGIIYVSFTEILVEEEKRKHLVGNKSIKKKR
ncbi:hypothetical protein [Acidianus sulfidivorans]|nr:hypothetical protein [Acidianus sulfidivorans]